jgi:Tfp pilus assembly protein PilF
MSVILDALKKAQEERRRANSRPTDGDEFPAPSKIDRLYVLFGLALLLLAVIFFIPDLRQALKFGTRAGGTPSTVQNPSRPAGPGDQAALAKGSAQRAAEPARQETLRPDAGAPKQPLMAGQPPKISWAPSIQVPAGARQGALSTVPFSAPEPKSPSPFDTPPHQSIMVRTSDVKDTAAQMYNNALKEMELGKTEEARRSYLAALVDKPDDAETLNNLGVLVMNGGNTRDAFSYFKMALGCREDYPKAHNNLGILYMKEGQNRPAEEHLRRALKLDPDGVEPYLNLSALLRSEGRFEEASRLLSGLMQKGFKQPIVYLSQAIISDEMGNHPEAITYYREYLSQSPQGAERGKVMERLSVLESRRTPGGNR